MSDRSRQRDRPDIDPSESLGKPPVFAPIRPGKNDVKKRSEIRDRRVSL